MGGSVNFGLPHVFPSESYSSIAWEYGMFFFLLQYRVSICLIWHVFLLKCKISICPDSHNEDVIDNLTEYPVAGF